MADTDYTTTLFLARECFVYRVPPRASAAGYKATEWGDMEAFLWKGRLRILEIGEKKCEIRLEDASSGELFALCPYDITGTSVEPVLDSSRYFVLRVESDQPGGGTRKAYIGMGFQDRSDSFDFNVALQDWTKRQKSLLNPPSPSSSSFDSTSTEASPHLPAGPKKDFSLKQGETISVKLPGGGGRKIGGTGLGAAPNLFGSGGGGGGLLPPPPGKRR